MQPTCESQKVAVPVVYGRADNKVKPFRIIKIAAKTAKQIFAVRNFI
jgi:hypothetical protein